MIRQKFGSAENFLDMVRTAYPPVYRPRDTEFRGLEMTWDGPVQEVFFFGPDGEPAVGYYLMEQQPAAAGRSTAADSQVSPRLTSER